MVSFYREKYLHGKYILIRLGTYDSHLLYVQLGWNFQEKFSLGVLIGLGLKNFGFGKLFARKPKKCQRIIILPSHLFTSMNSLKNMFTLENQFWYEPSFWYYFCTLFEINYRFWNETSENHCNFVWRNHYLLTRVFGKTMASDMINLRCSPGSMSLYISMRVS